jgi:hypothetical protein
MEHPIMWTQLYVRLGLIRRFDHPSPLSVYMAKIYVMNGKMSLDLIYLWRPVDIPIISVRRRLSCLTESKASEKRIEMLTNISAVASGPNFPLANGCLIPCLEMCVTYAFRAASKIQTEGIKYLCPQPEAVDDFQDHKDVLMKDLVWTSDCRSWYTMSRQPHENQNVN